MQPEYPVRPQTTEVLMRSVRFTETKVLGYSIERVDEYDDVGLLRSMRREVLCP